MTRCAFRAGIEGTAADRPLEVEIFAEGVDRHHDGWNTVLLTVVNAISLAKRITQKITHALMRDATELLQQFAMKSKVRSQHFWNAEGDLSMRHGREDRLRQQRAEHLHLLLVA